MPVSPWCRWTEVPADKRGEATIVFEEQGTIWSFVMPLKNLFAKATETIPLQAYLNHQLWDDNKKSGSIPKKWVRLLFITWFHKGINGFVAFWTPACLFFKGRHR